MALAGTRRPSAARRGGAVIEFAALLPFLIYLAIIGTDWARLFYYTIAIEGSARTGALYAADPVSASESPYKNVTEAALGSAPNLRPTPTVTSTPETVSGQPGVRVTVSVQFDTLTRFPGVPRSETLVRSVWMRMIPITPE